MFPSPRLMIPRLRALSLLAFAGAALLPAASFASTILVNQDFNDGDRTGIFSSSTNTTLAVQGGALVQTGGGRGILRYFDPTTLTAVGDTITLSHTFTIQAPITDNKSSSAELRFALFNSNGGTKITDDNWNSTDLSPYRGYSVTLTEWGTDDGGKGQWTVRTRTGETADAPKLINSNNPFASVGSASVVSASWAAGVPYNVTVTATKVATGVDITTTVTGGAFGTEGVTFTRTDTGSTTPAVYTFDSLCIYTSSAAGSGFIVDDLSVVYTPNVSVSAPTIVVQPTNQAVLAGGAVTFNVAATGEPLTYQWKKDGNDISGATNATYAVASAQQSDAASYSVVVTNEQGSVTSDAGSLLVVAAPAGTNVFSENFSTNTTRTGWYGSSSSSSLAVTEGALVQTTGSSGRGLLTYFTPKTLDVGESLSLVFGFKLHGSPGSSFATGQWRFGLFDSGGVTQVDADNFGSTSYHSSGSAYDFGTQKGYGAFMGQTSWSVNNRNISNPQIISMTAAYTAVGDTETPAFTFDVETNYVVTMQVQRTASGSDVTITVAGGDFGSGTSFTRSDTSADAVSAFDFFAIHSLSNLSDSFSIDDVNVFYTSLTPPAITSQPAPQSVAVGSSASFSVTASGTAPLSYQWKKDGVDISGATSATFSLSDVQVTDAGDYSVVVSNDIGSTTSDAAALTVLVTPVSITSQPASASVLIGADVTFGVTATGTAPLSYQWKKDDVALAGETASSLSLTSVQLADSGVYTVVVTNPAGSVTSNPATLTVSATAVAPSITTPPASQTLTVGSALNLTVDASGTTPFTYQWFKDGVAISGATSASYSIASVTTADAGSYTVEITNGGGTVTSAAAVLTVNDSYLSNLSVRASMASAQNLIVGFVVQGGSKPVLVRAAGPALGATFDLTGYLPDPRVTLYDADGATVASNEDWTDDLAATFAQLGAFAFESGSKDAAVLKTLASANTAHAPAGSVGGIQLVEVYDAGTNNGVKLVNVSARNHVGTGADILIAGFVIAGDSPKQVLIRGIGPGLAYQFDLTGVLADPRLTIYTSSGAEIQNNDDWDASLAPTFSRLGAFDLEDGSKDAALLIELAPGVYTAQLSGANNGTGEGLIEIYDAQP